MWTSKTGQFGQQEMNLLEDLPVGELVQGFINSDPIVVLRGLVEILLNGDVPKFAALCKYELINRRWQEYESDESVNDLDHIYADIIRIKLARISPGEAE